MILCDFKMVTVILTFMNAMEGLHFPLTLVGGGCSSCADLGEVPIVCGTDSGVLWQVESR